MTAMPITKKPTKKAIAAEVDEGGLGSFAFNHR